MDVDRVERGKDKGKQKEKKRVKAKRRVDGLETKAKGTVTCNQRCPEDGFSDSRSPSKIELVCQS